MAVSPVTEIAPGIFRVADTCHVYVVRTEGGGRTAFAVDFGSGRALDHLAEMGVDRITDVLMTHHHRDQGQGLPRAVAAGARVHVPPVEQDLFANVDEMWRTRRVWNDYNLRQERFSLLDPVPVAGLVPEYRTATYAGTPVRVLPTPGHTIGSVSYLVERGGSRIAFTGDLIYRPGKVWSLAATQWSYTETEGPAMTVLSCHQLLAAAAGRARTRARRGDDRRHRRAGAAGRADAGLRRLAPTAALGPAGPARRPYTPITEHLLLNKTSESHSYVLVSETGAALLIDYGYDMITGLPFCGR